MKKYQNIMEFSEIFPMELFSGGRTDDLGLPNEYNGLHDCMELVVSDGCAQSEGCLSPDTDVSVENVSSWLDEIGDIPNDLDSILNSEDIFNYVSIDDRADEIRVKNASIGKSSPWVNTPLVEGKSSVIPSDLQIFCSPVFIEQKPIEVKDNSRRKQKIVPIFEEVIDSLVDPTEFEYKQKIVSTEGNDELLDIFMNDNMLTKPVSPSSLSQISDFKSKEEPKRRRKRGLSNVEKRDRKKESNRNASFRYRQRKKQQKVDFVNYSQTLNEQLETAQRSYFQAAEELLRYIKHANLIRSVKDECSQLLLES